MVEVASFSHLFLLKVDVKMYFINELKKISKENWSNIAIFIDMDGVIADYRFGEGKNIENNVPGTYLNKRPILTAINILKEVNNAFDFDMYILSSCRHDEQAIEKSKWLEKNMPFIDKKHQLFVVSNTFSTTAVIFEFSKSDIKSSQNSINFFLPNNLGQYHGVKYVFQSCIEKPTRI